MSKKPTDFLFKKILGEGSFATVYAGVEVENRREVAIKVCEKRLIQSERKAVYVMNEKNLMARLNDHPHPFLVRLFYTFQDSSRLYFVMSLAKNGDLLAYLKKLGSFSGPVCQFYSAELVVALEHLHGLGIVHRDIKPENILLSEQMHIMVSDFGSAKDLNRDASRPTPLAPRPQKRSSFVGTAQYVSPEVLNGEPCTVCCDFWAVGCVIYQLLSGRPPFRAPNEYLIFQKINKLDYTFPDGFPEVAARIVRGFLKLSGAERLGSTRQGGYKSIKEHPFFDGIDWDTLPEQKPPAMLPYLPGTATSDAFSSTYCVPESVEPGLDDKQLTRLLGLNLRDVKPSYSEVASRLLLSKEDRQKQLKEQQKNVYHRFVENNLMLKSGLLDKRKGLFARRRMFLLTEGPHLYYVDPVAMEYKGQIPWSVELRAEAKNFKIFFVHTPNRTYYLEDPSGHAPDWCDIIEQVRQHYYCRPEDGVQLVKPVSS